MVRFAIIYRNLRIKQEKDDDAPPSPRGPWLRGPWIKLPAPYESLNAAREAFERSSLGLAQAHQFSIVVEEFDLGEPPGDSKARGLLLPYTWMYECCTLDHESGLQNDDQLFIVNSSWMVFNHKRTELDNDWVRLRVIELSLSKGALLKTWGEEGEHQGARADPEYRPYALVQVARQAPVYRPAPY